MELNIDQMLQQGVAAHNAGNLQEAERLYRTVLQSEPAHPDANHNLGVLAVSVNNADAALPLFKLALEANPKIEQFWLSYIDALIKEKQFENARQVLSQAKQQGVAEEKLNALEVQLSSVNPAENVGSANPPQELMNSLAEHYQNGRFGDAEKLAVEITQEFPTDQFAWKVLGAVFGATGRKSEAVDANQTAVALSPQDAEAHNNLGVTLQEVARLDEAAASYRQAIALKPDYAQAHYNLGNTLKELRRLDEAEASYRQAITLMPDFSEAHKNLGIALGELGRLDEAEASLKKAITLKPNKFADAYDQLGFILQKKGEFDEAEVCFKKWSSLEPKTIPKTLSKGTILFKQGSFEQALAAFENYDDAMSKGQILESLCALGRVGDIYSRLDATAGLDDENLRVAAIAAFLAEREKKNTAHNFCNNPMDFLYYANISSSIKDYEYFIESVIDELRHVQAKWELNTTRNGFQADFDVFKNPSLKKMSMLKGIILDEIDIYYSKFKNKSCSYIKKWPSKKNIKGWHVVLKTQGHQTPHIHPTGWLSGVIYLKVVPDLGKNEGAIEFSLNGQNYHHKDSPSIIFQPEVGDIVFFPSSLHHRTIPFTTDTERIIVSFDLKPETAR